MMDPHASGDESIRALFLTSGRRVPSTRFRILPFAPHLTQAGIRCRIASSFPEKYDYYPWMGFRPSQWLKRMVRHGHLWEARLRHFDVVFIERELFNDSTTDMEDRFRRTARRIVLDLDDPLFLRFPEKTEYLVRMSDLVIAGNPWIAREIADWNPRLVIIPTGVELARYPVRESHVRKDVPVVGWIGTVGNLQYLEVVAPALRKLARQFEFELRLIVPELKLPDQVDLSGLRLRHVPWNPATEVEELCHFDIGLMPLFSDREWDKYKCPTKLTQYMAMGIPAVASGVGFTGDVVTHGVDGLRAESQGDWEENLASLFQDVDLRQRLGTAARETVASKYCVEANWSLLADALWQAHRL